MGSFLTWVGDSIGLHLCEGDLTPKQALEIVRPVIAPETGKLELHVTGLAGPVCDDVAKLAKELLGEAGHEQKTSEYYLRTQVRPQIRPKSG